MSLRARLLGAILGVHLVMLAALAFALHWQNRRVLASAAASFYRSVPVEIGERLRGVSASGETGTRPLFRLFNYAALDFLCRDVLVVGYDDDRVTDGDGEARFPRLLINPRGAFRREGFVLSDVLDGIEQAAEDEETVPAAGGFCMPIRDRSERIVGGAWFLPHGAAVPILPFGNLLLIVSASLLVLGSITYFGVDRWVLRPLTDLGAAASSLERGELGTQVAEGSGAQELAVVAAGFNRASRILQEHEEELAEAVQKATARAKRRERELILSGRLAALGTMAAGIAHEINNPLGAMVNSVRRLRKVGARAGSDPEQDVYLELLDEGLERIGNIVKRTLDFAPRTVEPIRFPIQSAIEKARAMVEHRVAKTRVKIVIDAQPEDDVRGDPHELAQVFLNLFLNSLDAFDEGKTRSPRIRVVARPEEGPDAERLLRVSVEDNGKGADDATIRRAFDPFFSTKGGGEGDAKISTGLGMSISYAIISQHGGRMSLATPDRGGFRVEIVLPRAD